MKSGVQNYAWGKKGSNSLVAEIYKKPGDDIIENTARIQGQFERWIREAPELWMWGQRRWSSESLEMLNENSSENQA